MTSQMVFRRDTILNTPIWEAIRRRKQQLTDKNNQNKNKNCKLHNYIVCEKVLVRDKRANKYKESYKVPYLIAKVRKNGTITINQGAIQEHINIRWIKPYR